MNRLFACLIAIFTLIPVHAQYKDNPLQLSLIGSGGLVWQFNDSPILEPMGLMLSGDAELHADYYFQPHFAFSTGVNWALYHAEYELTSNADFSFQDGPRSLASGDEVRYGLSFLEIPIGLKMSSREIGYISYFADYGVRPMWRLGTSASTSDGLTVKEHAIKEIKRFNVGYQFDLGFKYSLGNKTCIICSLYYRNTFLDLTSDYLAKPEDNSRLNTAGIRLGFGF